MSEKSKLKVYSVRADADMMALASYYGIDIAELFRNALIQEIMKKEGKCPTCNQKVKWEKIK